MGVYIKGDCHGVAADYRLAMSEIQNPRAEDIIIITGDAGLEYGQYVNGSCKKLMKKFPGSWIIMRGNHDNRYWRDHAGRDGWEVTDKWGTQVLFQKKYPNIFYIKDEGDILEINDCSYLFVPGAYSVDKWYRLGGNKPYEWEEQLTYAEFSNLYDKVSEYDNIDFVVGHTFPHKLEPFLRYLFLDFVPQGEVDKTTEKWLDRIMEIVEDNPNFKHYFGGHYHDDRQLTSKYTLLHQSTVKVEDYL